MKNTSALIFLAAFIWQGCATPAPTPAGSGDSIVVNAEKVTTIAVDTFDGFLKFEYNNREQLRNVPAIHKYAETLRIHAPDWLASARAVTQAYKHNRTAENRANMQTAVAVLLQAMTETQHYLAKTTVP